MPLLQERVEAELVVAELGRGAHHLIEERDPLLRAVLEHPQPGVPHPPAGGAAGVPRRLQELQAPAAQRRLRGVVADEPAQIGADGQRLRVGPLQELALDLRVGRHAQAAQLEDERRRRPAGSAGSVRRPDQA